MLPFISRLGKIKGELGAGEIKIKMNRRKFFKSIGLGGVNLSLIGCRKSQDKTQDKTQGKYREVRLDELCKNKEKYIGTKVLIIGFIPYEKNLDPSYRGTSRDFGPSALAFNLVGRSHYRKWRKGMWKKYEDGHISYKDFLEEVCNEPKINCWANGHSCGEAYLALLDASEKAPHIAIDIKGTVGRSHLRVEELFIPVSSVDAEIPFFYDKPWR